MRSLRRITKRDAAFFAFGAFAVFAVGGLIVRTVFNCSIDGTTFWTAVGSLGIISTALIAWQQFQGFNDNERAKNTLAFITKFEDQVAKLCIAITSYASGSNQNVRDVNYDIYEDYKRTAEDLADAERALRAAGSYAAIADRYIEVHNYFTSVLTLLERGLLDDGLFFAIMGQTIVDTNFAGGRVMAQVGEDQKLELSALEDLAKRAIALQPSLRPMHKLTEIDAPEGGPPAAGRA